MPRPYFRELPNLEYVNRFPGASSGEYIEVKNLFKRGKISDEIFENLMFFERYQIVGDERPDNVAFKFYEDETLDWLIFLSNNIVNVQTEWPLSQSSLEKFLLEKYDSYDNLYNGIHHYVSEEVKNSVGETVVQEGIIRYNLDSDIELIDYRQVSSIIVFRNYSETKKVFITFKTGISNLTESTQLFLEGVEDNRYNGFVSKDEEIFITSLNTKGDYIQLITEVTDAEIGDVYMTRLPSKTLWIYDGTNWLQMGPAQFDENNNLSTSFVFTTNDEDFVGIEESSVVNVDSTSSELTVDGTTYRSDAIVDIDQYIVENLPLTLDPKLNRVNTLDYVSYYDYGLGVQVDVPYLTYFNPVTNYDYEIDLENKKRNIYILKPEYLNTILDGIEEFMEYKEGADQNVTNTLKRVQNIRLYQ